jgi:hypothetical protein
MRRSPSRAAARARRGRPTSLEFFGHLKWLDGKPLLDTIEPYRRAIFAKALDSGAYTLTLAGRGKKNWKSADLVLAALYCFVIRRSVFGNDGYILANDQDQAGDDLSLARKLVECNPDLAAEIEPLAKELRLRDGSGSLKILPAKDVAGAHGKSAGFVGFDEIHAYRNWSLLEALQPDPHRAEALIWVTSYASIYNTAGAPLYDLMQIGKAGTDPRMLFSWYSGDYCTDPAFAALPPEQRANPSMASWVDGSRYIEQQRGRLPSGRFRRLHLNLPGAPEGAAFDQGAVLACVVTGRRILPPQPGISYRAFVDMSGGSSDDAVLAIGHREGRIAIIDRVEKQIGTPPLKPQAAVPHFARIMAEYGCAKVFGDSYGGNTFRAEFYDARVAYTPCYRDKSQLYEAFEPVLNAREVELLDLPTLIEQTVSLVWRGQKIDHESNSHDDWINAVAGLVFALCDRTSEAVICAPIIVTVPLGESSFSHPGW